MSYAAGNISLNKSKISNNPTTKQEPENSDIEQNPRACSNNQ
jgi:hypothetical protein